MSASPSSETRTGGCLCGAVRFEVVLRRRDIGACHCSMCQRWTGSAFLGISVAEDDLRIEGLEHVERLASSDWAERAWCGRCGSGLWYRITREGRFSGSRELPIGLLDDPSGLDFVRELFVDQASPAFAYADRDAHRLLTQADLERLFRRVRR